VGALLYHATGPMIDLRYVKKLIEMLDESTVDSIEISSDKGFKVRLSKSPVQRGAVSVAAPVALPAMLPPVVEPRSTPAAGTPAVEAPPSERSDGASAGMLEVKSPMVGTFYSAPEPGADPYVKVGSRVSAGQTVCIIEAMKIMNEIEAEFGGVVREVLVENSQAVEFGQALFRVDPHG